MEIEFRWIRNKLKKNFRKNNEKKREEKRSLIFALRELMSFLAMVSEKKRKKLHCSWKQFIY
jgi:hypothetical protein